LDTGLTLTRPHFTARRNALDTTPAMLRTLFNRCSRPDRSHGTDRSHRCNGRWRGWSDRGNGSYGHNGRDRSNRRHWCGCDWSHRCNRNYRNYGRNWSHGYDRRHWLWCHWSHRCHRDYRDNGAHRCDWCYRGRYNRSDWHDRRRRTDGKHRCDRRWCLRTARSHWCSRSNGRRGPRSSLCCELSGRVQCHKLRCDQWRYRDCNLCGSANSNAGIMHI
jgi:hypothetical protein